MGRSQKVKGEGGEREATGLLTDLLGVVVKRKLGQARDGGTDVRVGNCLVEVKRQERARLQMWMKQAEDAAEPGELVAVMWRPSRKRWLVCMPVEDWATLVREAGMGGDDRDDLGQWGNDLGRGVNGVGPDSGHPGTGNPGGVAVGQTRRNVAPE